MAKRTEKLLGRLRAAADRVTDELPKVVDKVSHSKVVDRIPKRVKDAVPALLNRLPQSVQEKLPKLEKAEARDVEELRKAGSPKPPMQGQKVRAVAAAPRVATARAPAAKSSRATPKQKPGVKVKRGQKHRHQH